MQRFIYTRHAEKRMRRRSVSLDHIRATVRYPDRKHPGNFPKTVKFWKKISNRTCFVVVELKGEEVIVITTGWVENPS